MRFRTVFMIIGKLEGSTRSRDAGGDKCSDAGRR
jgi:hypothetical protein